MARLLLVDDEPSILQALRRLLAQDAHEIATFTDAEQGLAHAFTHDVDLAISDYRMPNMDGVTFLANLKHVRPDAMRIIFSAYTDFTALLGAINEAEIYRFITKPWNDLELRETVRTTLAHREAALENRRLADELRAQRRALSQRDEELRRLEKLHPGITKVNWGPDGSVLLAPQDAAAEG